MARLKRTCAKLKTGALPTNYTSSPDGICPLNKFSTLPIFKQYMISRLFLGFYTFSKLENKYMKHRNINNMKLKRLILKILTLLRKCLVNSLKNLLKHRLGNESMLNRRGRQGLHQNQAKTWVPSYKTPSNLQFSQDYTTL